MHTVTVSFPLLWQNNVKGCQVFLCSCPQRFNFMALLMVGRAGSRKGGHYIVTRKQHEGTEQDSEQKGMTHRPISYCYDQGKHHEGWKHLLEGHDPLTYFLMLCLTSPNSATNWRPTIWYVSLRRSGWGHFISKLQHALPVASCQLSNSNRAGAVIVMTIWGQHTEYACHELTTSVQNTYVLSSWT